MAHASVILLVAWAWCFQAIAAPSEGERLAYVVGCINCHHQTPQEIINAPPLLIVRAYSLDQFQKLLRTGVTISGRDLLATSSIMGIVAKEQFSHFTEDEVRAIYTFLTREWTEQRAAEEEAKIPLLYRAKQQEPE